MQRQGVAVQRRYTPNRCIRRHLNENASCPPTPPPVGYCGKAVAGEIALAGAADVPVAEEWEEATARGSETKSMEVRTDVSMLPRWT